MQIKYQPQLKKNRPQQGKASAHTKGKAVKWVSANNKYQFRLRRNDKRGDGSAVSLPRSIVGRRHCRLLRLLRLDHSDANGFDMTNE